MRQSGCVLHSFAYFACILCVCVFVHVTAFYTGRQGLWSLSTQENFDFIIQEQEIYLYAGQPMLLNKTKRKGNQRYSTEAKVLLDFECMIKQPKLRGVQEMSSVSVHFSWEGPHV